VLGWLDGLLAADGMLGTRFIQRRSATQDRIGHTAQQYHQKSRLAGEIM
jgi:hypothetical protein